jgi:hypothetical protein
MHADFSVLDQNVPESSSPILTFLSPTAADNSLKRLLCFGVGFSPVLNIDQRFFFTDEEILQFGQLLSAQNFGEKSSRNMFPR